MIQYDIMLYNVHKGFPVTCPS